MPYEFDTLANRARQSTRQRKSHLPLDLRKLNQHFDRQVDFRDATLRSLTISLVQRLCRPNSVVKLQTKRHDHRLGLIHEIVDLNRQQIHSLRFRARDETFER